MIVLGPVDNDYLSVILNYRIAIKLGRFNENTLSK
jgi:hypothetical protein